MRTPSPLALAALAAALLTSPAPAQEGARLVLSFGAGGRTGHGLWTIPVQPIEDSGDYDSLRLARSIGAGLLATFSATYFPGGHLGLYGDATFLDMAMENSCSPVVPFKRIANETLCTNFGGSIDGNSSLLLGLGAVLRAAPAGTLSPYVRAGLGFALHSHGTVRADAPNAPTSPPKQIIADDDPKNGSPTLLLAAGLSQALGSGYQIRLEVRDDFFALERVTGPANALGQAATATRWYHHLALTIGVGIVFDRRRTRRY